MHIKVITFDDVTFTLEVKPTDTIFDVKAKILNIEGIPKEQQKISFAGKVLQNHRTLRDYNIQNGSTINVDLYYTAH